MDVDILCRAIPLFLLAPYLALSQSSGPVDLVDPFLGTGGHGHTFPGATVPFGMVQLSPDTRVAGWDACGGYHYSDSSILGFSHTHLSGTGIGDYGDILFAPMVGSVRLDPGSPEYPGYRSRFSHSDEEASPGYYRVFLADRGTTVELTTSRRAGFHRYSFPPTDSAWIVIDLVHGIGPDVVTEASMRRTGPDEVSGYRWSKGWALDQRVYFVAQFSVPFRSAGISDGDSLQDGRTEAKGLHVKAGLRFSIPPGEPLLVRVGLSSVDLEGARRNLEAEIDHWNFEAVRQDAREAWEAALSKIVVTGGSVPQQRTFATALYHTMIAPNLFSDSDRRYRTMDGRIGTADGFERYTVFSLWDTFRAAHPLFTIIEPDRTNDFIRSFLSIYEEAGALPVWELAANETWCMIGYHSVSVITDAYAKGIRGYDAEAVYTAMLTSAMKDHYGMRACRLHGFVPSEMESESVSKTLEYAYDDWCISELARLLGRKADEKLYARRAESYRNLFDPEIGFMRAKQNGAWKEPFHPRAVTVDFTEANAWQYAFFAPHNVSGMIDMYGGREKFAVKLDSLFSVESTLEGRNQADITGLIGQYAHGNEPSHHIAYLYTYAGQPWKTQQLVRRIMDEFYTDKPDGLIGNEDCGQMSAWYVLSALGFYPVNPGQPTYTLGSPLFPEARITLPNGKLFIVRSDGPVESSPFVERVTLDGKSVKGAWLSHDAILRGGDLTFTLTGEPNTRWGTSPEDAPPSPTAASILLTPVSSAESVTFANRLTVALSCRTPGAMIRYTTDGTDPGSVSDLYTKPLRIARTTTIRARAFIDGLEPSGLMESVYTKHARIGTVVSVSDYSPQYAGGGDQAVLDGVRGMPDFRVGGWQGYEEIDCSVVIDLGSERPVSSITASFLQDINAWIFFPQEVSFEISQDGLRYAEVYRISEVVPVGMEGALVEGVTCGLENTTARFIRMTARNIGRCPAWHKGSGGKAWLFIDEIEVF